MAKETLYPERQRCKKCGKGFPERGALDGLFCSYRCGGFAEPFKKIDDAPRWCKTQKNGKWEWKKRMRSAQELPKALRNDATVSMYWCDHCHFLHLGGSESKNLKFDKKDRLVSSRVELAEILVKSRGDASLREIGKASGLQPIRIKELEDPTCSKIDVVILFKLLEFYKLKLAVVFR